MNEIKYTNYDIKHTKGEIEQINDDIGQTKDDIKQTTEEMTNLKEYYTRNMKIPLTGGVAAKQTGWEYIKSKTGFFGNTSPKGSGQAE